MNAFIHEATSTAPKSEEPIVKAIHNLDCQVISQGADWALVRKDASMIWMVIQSGSVFHQVLPQPSNEQELTGVLDGWKPAF